MSFVRVWLLAVLCLCPALARSQTSNDPQTNGTRHSSIHWVIGPAQADMKQIAGIKVPEGYVFANAADTRKILEAGGNPTSGAELGLMTTAAILNGQTPDWFMVFEFEDTGYVKDDDKDKLNADKLLKEIKQGNDAANEYRTQHGSPPLTITGWEQPPKYNPETHNLEWAIRGESEGRPVLNYSTRLLGRKGVMSVDLVVEPDLLAATMPTYQSLLTGYSYKTGETYAEYKPGDKLAKYGLAGLITAGAVVVAAKTGLLAAALLILKKAWKLIVVAVAAVAAAIKNFFARLFGGGKNKPDAGSSPPA